MARNKFISEKTKIDKEISKLRKRAEMLQERERKPVLNTIVASMREYSITPDEVAIAFAKRSGSKPVRSAVKQMKSGGTTTKKSKQAVAPKYLDPETGNTWTGRGKPPRWLSDAEQAGKNRDAFLINGDSHDAPQIAAKSDSAADDSAPQLFERVSVDVADAAGAGEQE